MQTCTCLWQQLMNSSKSVFISWQQLLKVTAQHSDELPEQSYFSSVSSHKKPNQVLVTKTGVQLQQCCSGHIVHAPHLLSVAEVSVGYLKTSNWRLFLLFKMPNFYETKLFSVVYYTGKLHSETPKLIFFLCLILLQRGPLFISRMNYGKNTGYTPICSHSQLLNFSFIWL